MGESGAKAWAMMGNLLAMQIIADLKHVIRCLDGLGVHFVCPLRDDHVDHFLDDFDVGHFKIVLGQHSEPIRSWLSLLSGARGGCFAIKVSPDTLQT